MNLSYWEVDTWFRKVDLLVIGSGIVGLNAALHARQLHPHMNIMVLERGILPDGASTKNAGFACFGSVSELLDDLKNRDFDEVVQLAIKRYQGLKAMRKLLGDSTIGFEQHGGFELFMPSDGDIFHQCLDLMPRLNAAFRKEIGEDCYSIADDLLPKAGFVGVEHLIFNRFEGQIHTGNMMRALTGLCHKEDITILNGVKVNDLEWDDHGVHIMLEGKSIRAGNLIVATNGFAAELLNVDVTPARAQVLITSPIQDLPFKGTFHYDKGYYYFRNVGNRILFGGGRNLDPNGESTTVPGLTSQIQQRLESLLRTMIVPDKAYNIEHRWSGVMGIGEVKSPIVKAIHPRVVCAVRMGGMGVALGTLTGMEAAELLNP